MDIYSADEVIKDISLFEGVGCKLLNVNSCNFLKLYSQCFNSRMSDDSTVNDLNKRINEFLLTENVMFPPCDVLPTEELKFWVYIPAINENSKVDLTTPMTLIESGNSFEAAANAVKREINDTGIAMVIDTVLSEIHCFTKQTH